MHIIFLAIVEIEYFFNIQYSVLKLNLPIQIEKDIACHEKYFEFFIHTKVI